MTLFGEPLCELTVGAAGFVHILSLLLNSSICLQWLYLFKNFSNQYKESGFFFVFHTQSVKNQCLIKINSCLLFWFYGPLLFWFNSLSLVYERNFKKQQLQTAVYISYAFADCLTAAWSSVLEWKFEALVLALAILYTFFFSATFVWQLELLVTFLITFFHTIPVHHKLCTSKWGDLKWIFVINIRIKCLLRFWENYPPS